MGFHTRLTKPPTCPLRPIIPNNARSLRITAAAGTELAGASSARTVNLHNCRSSSGLTGVYDPKAFILHAALRRQTFVHCVRFPVAATRRCMGRVSVPFCPFPLSGRVPVIGLVGHYPTNSLMGDRLIHRRAVKRFCLAASSGISSSFDEVFRTIGEIPIHYSAVRN